MKLGLSYMNGYQLTQFEGHMTNLSLSLKFMDSGFNRNEVLAKFHKLTLVGLS